jgi:hypothetical protein
MVVVVVVGLTVESQFLVDRQRCGHTVVIAGQKKQETKLPEKKNGFITHNS